MVDSYVLVKKYCGWFFLIMGIVITFFGWFLMPQLIAERLHFGELLGNLSTEGEAFLLYSHLFLGVGAVLVFVTGVMFLICGLGLMRGKQWARSVAIALVLGIIFQNIAAIQVLGPQRASHWGLVLVGILAVLGLWLFFRKNVKEGFEKENGDRKLTIIQKSVIVVIIVGSCTPLLAALIFKFYYSCHVCREPVFWANCGTMSFRNIEQIKTSHRYKQVDLLDTAISIPEDTIISGANNLLHQHFMVILGNSQDPLRWTFSRTKATSTLREGEEFLRKFFGFDSIYDFEIAKSTNTWSPIFIFLRQLDLADTVTGKKKTLLTTRTFLANSLKGILRERVAGNKKEYQALLYTSDGLPYMEAIRYSESTELVGWEDFLVALSSLTPLHRTKESAKEYYNEGRALIGSKAYKEAVFMFSNANYLDCDNAEYLFMLAKTLYRNNNDVASTRNMLQGVLEIAPGHYEATNLLNQLEKLVDQDKASVK